jgi:hypothetical protein
MIDFLNPEAIAEADAARRDEGGQRSVLDLIKASHAAR